MLCYMACTLEMMYSFCCSNRRHSNANIGVYELLWEAMINIKELYRTTLRITDDRQGVRLPKLSQVDS